MVALRITNKGRKEMDQVQTLPLSALAQDTGVSVYCVVMKLNKKISFNKLLQTSHEPTIQNFQTGNSFFAPDATPEQWYKS